MRILGLPVVAILLAAVIFNLVSFAWYAVLFGEAWVTSHGFAPGAGHEGASVWRAVGPLLALFQVIALALVLDWRGWPGIPGAVVTALVMVALIVLPVLAYDTVNLPGHNVLAFAIDAGHLAVAWSAAAAVLTVMHGRSTGRRGD